MSGISKVGKALTNWVETAASGAKSIASSLTRTSTTSCNAGSRVKPSTKQDPHTTKEAEDTDEFFRQKATIPPDTPEVKASPSINSTPPQNKSTEKSSFLGLKTLFASLKSKKSEDNTRMPVPRTNKKMPVSGTEKFKKPGATSKEYMQKLPPVQGKPTVTENTRERERQAAVSGTKKTDELVLESLKDLPSGNAANIINNYGLDQRARVLSKMEPKKASAILKKMNPEEAKDIRRIMTLQMKAQVALDIAKEVEHLSTIKSPKEAAVYFKSLNPPEKRLEVLAKLSPVKRKALLNSSEPITISNLFANARAEPKLISELLKDVPPQMSAQILMRMDPIVAAKTLVKLKDQDSGKILNEMEKEKSDDISKKINLAKQGEKLVQMADKKALGEALESMGPDDAAMMLLMIEPKQAGALLATIMNNDKLFTILDKIKDEKVFKYLLANVSNERALDISQAAFKRGVLQEKPDSFFRGSSTGARVMSAFLQKMTINPDTEGDMNEIHDSLHSMESFLLKAHEGTEAEIQEERERYSIALNQTLEKLESFSGKKFPEELSTFLDYIKNNSSPPLEEGKTADFAKSLLFLRGIAPVLTEGAEQNSAGMYIIGTIQSLANQSTMADPAQLLIKQEHFHYLAPFFSDLTNMERVRQISENIIANSKK